MPREKRRRFLKDKDEDIEAAQAEEKKIVEQYDLQPLDDAPEVAEETKERREALMRDWNDYFTVFHEINPDEVWFDLCLDRDHAKSRCRAFLRKYVTDSVRSFPVLGPEEYEERRTITSAHTLLNIWRCLIAQADDTVLKKRRRSEKERQDEKKGKKKTKTRMRGESCDDDDEFPEGTWRLKFMDHMNSQGRGPVFEISNWIFNKGADELGLCRELLVQKIEATAEDVMLVADTVVKRPDAVPCAPNIRIAFLAMLILASIGGFRPKALLNFKFRQVQIAVGRSPKDPSKNKIIVTFEVPIVKKRRSTQGNRPTCITFSLSIVPVPTICLASYTISLAIKADAFEPSVSSIDDLLKRPNLEHVDYVPLKWKTDMKDSRIFPLDYRTFWQLWYRGCLAAGLRKEPRVYTLRVGTGMDLDGVLADVLRNHIMSNTSAVFQKSYQSEHVRVNLLRVRFQRLYPGTGVWDVELEQAMRTMALKRDGNAPVSPSSEDLEAFERRTDVTHLRQELQAAKRANPERTSWNALSMRVRNLIQHLSNLAVRKRRAEYFDRVDRLRALGQSTMSESAGSAAPCTTAHSSSIKRRRLCHGGEALDEIVRFLQRIAGGGEQDAEPYDEEWWLDLLLGYLTNRPSVGRTASHRVIGVGGSDPKGGMSSSGNNASDSRVPSMEEGDEAEEREELRTTRQRCHEPKQVRQPGEARHVCLLCNSPFSTRDSLTGHCKRVHIEKGTFDRPFPCPECRRKSEPDVIITSPSSWSSHIERVHGKDNAPKLRTDAHSTCDEDKLCCPFCGLFLRPTGFHMHIKKHVPAGEASYTFLTPYACLACRAQNSQHSDQSLDIVIDGWQAWRTHVAQKHTNLAHIYLAGASSPSNRHACLICNNSFSSRSGLTQHCRNMHVKRGTFQTPFPCPACRRDSMPEHIVHGTSAWSRHVQAVHGESHTPNLWTDRKSSAQDSPCPFCGVLLSAMGAHSHFRGHVRAGASSSVFAAPFTCYACKHDLDSGQERSEAQSEVVIKDCSAWDTHVLAVHQEKASIWTVGAIAAGHKGIREGTAGRKLTLLPCLLCKHSFPVRGIVTHFRKAHLKDVESGPEACVACDDRYATSRKRKRRSSNEATWNDHVDSNHADVSRYFTIPNTPSPSGPRKRRKQEATTATTMMTPSSLSPGSPTCFFQMHDESGEPDSHGEEGVSDEIPMSTSDVDFSLVDPRLLD